MKLDLFNDRSLGRFTLSLGSRTIDEYLRAMNDEGVNMTPSTYGAIHRIGVRPTKGDVSFVAITGQRLFRMVDEDVRSEVEDVQNLVKGLHIYNMAQSLGFEKAPAEAALAMRLLYADQHPSTSFLIGMDPIQSFFGSRVIFRLNANATTGPSLEIAEGTPINLWSLGETWVFMVLEGN